MSDASHGAAGGFGQGDGEIEIASVGQALWRGRKWIAGATLLGFLGSVAFVTLVKPKYTAEAKALVENQESYFTRPEKSGAEPGQIAPDAEAVASQVQLVTSRDLAREAIRALGLKGNPEFDPAAGDLGLLAPVLSMLGMQKDTSKLAPEDRIFETYFERLFVFPVVKSRVLQIEFSSRDPELAAKAANTIAELYVGVQASAKRNTARVAAGSLAALTTELRGKVADAERKAEEYRAANGLLLGANNLTMNNQQLADINAQLALARATQADAQAKSRMIRDMLKQGRIGEVPDVANNELIRRLSEQRANLRGQIASEGRTLLPGHPRVKELNAQLVELESGIRTAADKAARTLENDSRIAGSRFENLLAALDQQKKTVGGASTEEVRARELDREARLLKEQLEAATAKYQEALARQAADSTPSDARIISRAVSPQLPSFPKKAPIVLFATLAGFILSAGTILAGELLSGRAYARRQESLNERVEPGIESVARARVDGSVDANAGQHAVEEFVDSPVAEQAAAPMQGSDSIGRRIETPASPEVAGRRRTIQIPAISSLVGIAGAIAGSGQSGSARRLLVVGVDSDVAAAEVAVALGRVLCADKRVVLLELVGYEAGDAMGPPGLGDLLAGHAGFEDAIHRDRGSRLHLLPVGRGGPALPEGLDVVMEALARTYDYLIVLAPPVQAGAGAYLAAPHMETAVLVCGATTSERACAEACAELRRAGIGEVLAFDAGMQATALHGRKSAA